MMENNESIRATLEQFAAGDFTYRAAGDDPMVATVNHLGATLETMIEGLMESQAVNCMSMFEVLATMSRMADGMSHIDERTLSMAAATEEMAATNQQIAESSQEAVGLSTQAVEAANHGSASVDNALQLLSDLAERARTARENVERLVLYSGEIDSIVASIQRIAGQTNMLALNATIEAARAGEAGQGFAVVAGEVKGLSQQTAKAASEISGKIGQLQGEIKLVVNLFGENVEHAEQGGAAAQDAGLSMQEVITAFSLVSEQIQHIRAAASDQGDASQEIAERTHEVSELVSTSAHEVGHTVGQMRDLESGIREQLGSLSQNKVTKGVLSLAKTDHMLWKKRLIDMMLGHEHIATDDVADHRHCRLGKWYYAEGKELYGQHRAFTALEKPHAEVHRLARETVEKFNKGDKVAASSLIEQLGIPSGEVVALLEQLQSNE
ncbi:methyl-accepting chemotaxis protein [Mariprofundus sp. EBB-1]|uniref:methyl-accepting chemotaxis protein n=1 Tax=Mariprofundus sp. EBB-1 TaxID=2650971 RepID=UPI001F2CB832|nr:methyl-accepting chemotaxis protein [Mariprofundus sp. EBB-1]